MIFSPKPVPFTVGVTGGLLRSAGETAAGALYGFSHRVLCLTESTPRHPGDAEVRLEEQMESTVRQQKSRMKNTGEGSWHN